MSNKTGMSRYVYVAFLITGLLGLVYQVTWTRMLVLSFGYSIYSVSTILASFMGGLSLGSLLGGHISKTSKNPVRTYSMLEILVGIVALLASLSLRFLPEWVAQIRFILDIPYYGFSPWVLMIALCILLPPAILMGATLPLLSKGLTRSSETGAMDIGMLYAINTFGASLGSLLTGFLFIAFLGIQTTLVCAALLNILVGTLIYKISPSFYGEVKPVTATTRPSLFHPILWAFGISGFASLASEVIWTRIFSPFLEGSTYAFSLVLAIFLLGIVLGSLKAKQATLNKDASAGYGLSQILVGITTGLGILLLLVFIRRFNTILPALGILLEEPFLLIKVSSWFTLILLPPTFFMGYGFPFIAKWASSTLREVGQRTGMAYAFNTIGAVIGALIAGFVLIPRLGVLHALILVATFNMISGFGLIILNTNPRLSFGRKAMSGMAMIIFAVLLWRLPDPNLFATKLGYPGTNILGYHEDADASISLVQYPEDQLLLLNINLRPVSASSTNLTPWMTHLPLMTQSNINNLKILNIGLGIGHTFTTALQYPNAEVYIVELLPGVVEIFKEFHDRGKELLADHRVHLTVGDGRSFLLSTQESFDAIIVDPTPPLYGAGAVNLYTKDFFEICKSKLTAHGLLMMRLPSDTNPFTLKLLLKTLNDVFPQISLWQKFEHTGYSLLAHRQTSPLPSTEELNRRVFEAPFLNEQEKSALINTQPVSLLSPDQIQGMIKNIRTVTDNHPYLENPLFFKWWDHDWKTPD